MKRPMHVTKRERVRMASHTTTRKVETCDPVELATHARTHTHTHTRKCVGTHALPCRAKAHPGETAHVWESDWALPLTLTLGSVQPTFSPGDVEQVLQSEQLERVGNWTQGAKRGRVSGMLSALLPRYWHRRTRKTNDKGKGLWGSDKGRSRGGQWQKVGSWTQGEKRGRVYGVLSASLSLLAQEDP
eukprot:6200526-Pyramimonas_sp.AAC.1